MGRISKALRDHGIEFTDWGVPGHSKAFHPIGILEHHTAARRGSGDVPSLGVVRDGRGGAYPLAPPVVQLLVGRSGAVHLISEGHSYHAGKGEARALEVVRTGHGEHRRATRREVNGNYHLIGIEIENDGIGERYPDVQARSVVLVTAALCREFGWDPRTAVLGHREWTPYKIDPNPVPALGTMNDLRAQVIDQVNAWQDPTMEDDMPLTDEDKRFITDAMASSDWSAVALAVKGTGELASVRFPDGAVFVIVPTSDGLAKQPVASPRAWKALRSPGVLDPDAPTVEGDDLAFYQSLPTLEALR